MIEVIAGFAGGLAVGLAALSAFLFRELSRARAHERFVVEDLTHERQYEVKSLLDRIATFQPERKTEDGESAGIRAALALTPSPPELPQIPSIDDERPYISDFAMDDDLWEDHVDATHPHIDPDVTEPPPVPAV
jgi:hypothetical protein